MKIKLAEALLRRKELQEKVDQLRQIDQNRLVEPTVKQSILGKQRDDDILVEFRSMVPKVSVQQITHAYDWTAKQLRKVDAAIQRANWDTEIDIESAVMVDYVDPYVKEDK